MDCRFCLETDSLNNLISPCLCKGTFQYIHNDCLMKWYKQAPERALKCTVCLEDFQVGYDIDLEDGETMNSVYKRCMEKPVYYLMISHGTMLVISGFMTEPLVYYFLHFIFHFIHVLHFIGLTKSVKNKGLYKAYWIFSPRMFIPPLIMTLFLSLAATRVLATFSIDMVLYLALHEHYEILSQINSQQKFFFKDRI